MKSTIQDFLEEIILGDDRNKEKKPIGLVSEELRQAYRAYIDEKEDLEAEIKFKHERIMKKVERELFEEYQPKMEQTQVRKKEIWEKIRLELGIKRDSELNIDTKSGVISEWVSKENR